MVKTRVFVSHANKGEKAFKPVLAVCEALQAMGFEAECDKLILQPGDDWYDRVNRAMARCNAAILLVDEEATASEYVRFESDVLGYRWHSEKTLARPFHLFIAFVDPDPAVNETLGSAHLARLFGPASKLDRVQRWSAPAALLGNPDLGPLATELAEQFVAGHGPPWTDDTPLALARFELWQALSALGTPRIEAVKSPIARIPEDGEAYTALKADIDAMKAEAVPGYLASWLAERAADRAEHMAELVHSIGTHLQRLDAHARQAFVESLFVLHSLWVANENCPIGAHLCSGTGGVIALNGAMASASEDTYTLCLFPAHRLFPQQCEVIPFDENALDAAVIADKLAERLFLRERNGLAPLSAPSRKLLAKHLTRNRCLCLLPREFASPAYAPDLQALRAKFHRVLFVIAVGEDLETADIDGAVMRIAPPIDPDVEFENWHYWSRTKAAVQ